MFFGCQEPSWRSYLKCNNCSLCLRVKTKLQSIHHSPLLQALPVIPLRCKLEPYHSCKWQIFPPNIMSLHFNEKWNRSLDRQLYLTSAQEGEVLLIWNNLCGPTCPTSHPLVLCIPSSFFVVVYSSFIEKPILFCGQMLPGSACGRSVGGAGRHCCSVFGLALMFSPLISCLQTAGEAVSHF